MFLPVQKILLPLALVFLTPSYEPMQFIPPPGGPGVYMPMPTPMRPFPGYGPGPIQPGGSRNFYSVDPYYPRNRDYYRGPQLEREFRGYGGHDCRAYGEC